jgi:hypothetical protein
MRLVQFSLVALFIGAVALVSPSAQAADKGKKKTPDKPTYNDLADEIFKKVDVHSHGYLNKIEFKRADGMLAAAIQDMVKQGTIGKKPAKNKAPQSPPQFTPGFATADTDHDNKVMQTEYTTYVNLAVNAADHYYQYEASQPQPKKR